MTRALGRATSLDYVYTVGLDALVQALHVSGASILLFDADGVMRFKAWSGLSDDYRASVEGHSPWALDTVNPQPVVVADVQTDAALSEEIRLRVFPNSRLRGEANLLIMPTLDAANISFNLLKTAAGGGVTVGPILLGAARPVHILTPSATVRRLVNMTALAVADANAPRGQEQMLL